MIGFLRGVYCPKLSHYFIVLPQNSTLVERGSARPCRLPPHCNDRESVLHLGRIVVSFPQGTGRNGHGPRLLPRTGWIPQQNGGEATVSSLSRSRTSLERSSGAYGAALRPLPAPLLLAGKFQWNIYTFLWPRARRNGTALAARRGVVTSARKMDDGTSVILAPPPSGNSDERNADRRQARDALLPLRIRPRLDN